MSIEDAPITLKEIQKRLQTPQHVLIHLCEKGVIEPDYQQTSGRGVRREFSRRNLFEFAIALSLRRFEIPVTTTAAIVRLTRSFDKACKRLIPGFELPGYLIEQKVDLSLALYDGHYLVFSARRTNAASLLLGFDLGKILASPAAVPKVEKLDAPPTDYDGCLSVELSRIARRLRADQK